LVPYTDLFLFDLKLMNPHRHAEYSGIDNRQILDNFRSIYRQGKKIIARIPLVEGITDTDENLDALIDFLSKFPELTRISLLPYHNIAKTKYQKLGLKYPLEHLGDYPQEKLIAIEKMFNRLKTPVSIGS
jgi:pyruvate formate lyase activating enzyme